MLFKSLISSALLATSALVSSVVADDLPEIEIVGSKFFYSNNGSQFFMKGIAYQQNTANSSSSSFVDPLADAEACKRDIPYLQELQTNVIRVYALNVSLDHTECMNMLIDAGIYVIADMSEPDESINRESPEWNLELFDRYTGVVDLFQNYTNVLGFFAGNEVTNDKTNTDASAFVKAAIRDTKAYIKAQGYRTIPVGYSANDDSDIRVALADYFACGSEEERADFFGINMYEWCGTSSYEKSGYESITKQYKNLGIPIFFSEYGCNEVSPRKFQEVATIYGDDMTDVWSGGIVYMYFQEENNYGLVSVSGSSVSTLKDFSYLKAELASISPSAAESSSVASTSVTSCPTSTSVWSAATNLPPTPDQVACECMDASVTCVVDSDVDSSDYEDLFDYVCAKIDCDGITANGTTGEYGAYSPCTSKQKLNFVLNLYYEENGSSSSACNFDGSATTQSAKTASSCSAYLKSAGTSGLGTISGSIQTTKHTGITATQTGSSKSTSSSSSTSTGSSSGSKQVSLGLTTKSLLVGAISIIGFGLIFA
mmetsp:Transcript_5116/g.5115  ORF Transcript_5116/g.5115 Transcript_5116/m.5115 type:complete len:541 (-) Transcript_5116:15-1637(-)